MTNSQKAKKYGKSAGTTKRTGATSAAAPRRGQHVHEMPNGALKAEPAKRRPRRSWWAQHS
ncbi:hypothetical protein [Kocuria atrinae]|uniref:hypothetical protein n=1 Tax=Kocuria atrinae TaxID=592377 RepID=UPI001CB93345|nr:hypothetical protein [Kocuria atrinae]